MIERVACVAAGDTVSAAMLRRLSGATVPLVLGGATVGHAELLWADSPVTDQGLSGLLALVKITDRVTVRAIERDDAWHPRLDVTGQRATVMLSARAVGGSRWLRDKRADHRAVWRTVQLEVGVLQPTADDVLGIH